MKTKFKIKLTLIISKNAKTLIKSNNDSKLVIIFMLWFVINSDIVV